MICVALMENNKKDVTDMAESKYHFERLTPIDDMDLEVYEEARKNMKNYAFCIFLSHTSSLQIKKMKQKRIKKEQMNLH